MAQSKKTQNIDNYYVIETEKGIYAHTTPKSAERHKKALEIIGKKCEIKTCPQLTIFEIFNQGNHKPVYLRGNICN